MMPPEENNEYDLFLVNENGDPVKIERFSEMPKCEVEIDPHIDLKSLCEEKFEAKIELTPESAAEIAKLQEQLDAEIVENLQQQIKTVDSVITSMKSCICENGCIGCQYVPSRSGCIDDLLKDAIEIAEAYKGVVEKGLKMMEERK